MRVTKLIKEYVEKKVREAYPKSEAELHWEAKSKRMNDAITEANEQVEAFAKKVAADLNIELGFNDDYKLEAYEGRNYFSNTWYRDCAEYRACRKAEDERNKKIKETIEEILISLELGGTRADLDEMLAKIGEGK